LTVASISDCALLGGDFGFGWEALVAGGGGGGIGGGGRGRVWARSLLRCRLGGRRGGCVRWGEDGYGTLVGADDEVSWFSWGPRGDEEARRLCGFRRWLEWVRFRWRLWCYCRLLQARAVV
jgi:hypothetical protein